MNLFRSIALSLALLMGLSGPSVAQWQTPDHSVPIGNGAGVTGFNSTAPGTATRVLASNGASTDPSFQTAPLSSWFDQVYCSTIGYLVVRTTGGWTCDNSIPGSVKWWGATGDGSTNDTAAVQAALTAMQGTGGAVYFPPGCYAVTNLTNTGRIKLSGSGYQGDSGGGFAGHGVTACTPASGSVIVCTATSTNCYTATTNQSVQIENLQFSYLSPATAGVVAITIQAVAGAGNANTQSNIHDVMVTGGDYGVALTNLLNFNFNNNYVLYQSTYGLVVNSPNFPSFQQAAIAGNLFWGAATVGYAAHILVQAGGDLRIIDNKLSTGGINTNSIALFGAASGAQNMEPMVIAGNSSEGADNCLTFSTANASFTASQIVITGNQFWCGHKAILVNNFGASQYVIGMTITGNILTVNGGASVNAVQINNVKNAIVTGNSFNCSGGCSTSTGITLGAFTTGINVQSNSYDGGYTTKVNNLAGGVNTVGGGSP